MEVLTWIFKRKQFIIIIEIQRWHILFNLSQRISSHFPSFRIWLITPSNKTQLQLPLFFSASACIALLTVYGIEAIAMVMSNALIISVCLKERNLRKRNMYLVIKQAVADMFVGASLISYYLFLGNICDLWTINRFRHKLGFPLMVLWTFLSIASFINLGSISLERTHATFPSTIVSSK